MESKNNCILLPNTSVKTIFNNQKQNKMKTIKLIAIGLFFLFQNGIFAQETGEIQGVIMEGETNLPLISATVKVYYAGNLIGDVTDFDGKFTIKPLVAGTYMLEVSYIGKATKKQKIIVKSSQIAFRDTIVLSEFVIEGKGVVIEAKIKLDPEEPSKPQMDIAQLKNMPDLRNPAALVSVISGGAISNTAAEGQVYFRGSRTNGIITYLDGMKITGKIPTFPAGAIKSMAVYTGGVPAKYGDTTGGVVVIETKSYFDLFNQRMAQEIARRGTTYQ